MQSYQRILIALSLEEPEDALQLARKARNISPSAELHLAHIEEHPITGFGELTGKNHQVNEVQIRQQVFPQLKRIGESLKIPVTQLHIAFGDPAPTILSLTKTLGCDLLVIGHHKSSGLATLFRTTAGDIVNEARVDTLAIYLK